MNPLNGITSQAGYPITGNDDLSRRNVSYGDSDTASGAVPADISTLLLLLYLNRV